MTSGIIIDDTCRNEQDLDEFIKVIRKKNQLDKKKNTIEKPTYTNDSDMDKIAETIGILNVNWDDARSLKDGNKALNNRESSDFVAKDKSYAHARLKYAIGHVINKILADGTEEVARTFKEAWSAKSSSSNIQWVRCSRQAVSHLFTSRAKCKADPGINFKAYVTHKYFSRKNDIETRCKLLKEIAPCLTVQLRPGDVGENNYQVHVRMKGLEGIY